MTSTLNNVSSNPVKTTSSALSNRRRMHSWSRIRRSPEEKARLRTVLFSAEHFDDTQQEVEGRTEICFERDGEWFQGNIHPPHHCVFQIQGRRISPTASETPLSMTSSSSIVSSCASSESSDASMASRRMSESSVSESCSIDSDAVQEALEKLEEEEENSEHGDEYSDITPEVYKVTVSDMETGLSYRLNVSVLRSEDTCRISSEQLNFRSASLIKGCRANRKLVSQFGPSFVDQDLAVYEGEVSFRYTDKVYRPAHTSDTAASSPASTAEFWL